MRINTNVSSLTAQEAAQNTGKSITGSLEKLSTGSRINKASDDASGLAIADKLRTQATSIKQGIDNGNSAVALLQIADKSMGEQSNILDTIKAKLIQANTSTTSEDGRESIRKDINKLLTQLDNIAKQTNYNGTSLLQASRNSDDASSGLSFQIGESNTDLITNTAIQSNTKGLAGTQEGLTTGENDKVDSKGSQIIKSDGNAVTFTGTTATEVALSGKIGTLLAGAGDATISNVSSADVEKLNKLADGTNFINNNDGTYTLKGGESIDFDTDVVNSINVKATGNQAVSVTTAANDYISVKNLTESGDALTIGGTASDAKVGLDLTSLVNLKAGELTTQNADIYQGVVDTSITQLNQYRGDIGSTQNQVESAVRNLMTQATNVKAAESVIRDVDYAEESANFNKQNIISQAGSYAISQANAVQQNVLRLLQ